MAKNTESDAPAPETEPITPAAETAAPPADEAVATKPSRTGRVLALAGGAVLASALLFGGGLALGLHLPHGGGHPGPGISQGMLPGGDLRPDGPRGDGLRGDGERGDREPGDRDPGDRQRPPAVDEQQSTTEN